MSRVPPSRAPRAGVTIAGVLVGLCAAAVVTGHPRAAFFLSILAAAAALTVLRALVQREP